MTQELKIHKTTLFDGCRLQIDERNKNKVSFNGINMGPCYLLRTYSGWRLAKTNGHNGWAGRGDVAYRTPVYYLFKIADDNKVIETWEGHDFGKFWKDGITQLLQKTY